MGAGVSLVDNEGRRDPVPVKTVGGVRSVELDQTAAPKHIPDRTKPHSVIPLTEMAAHLRVYQHSVSGEILVLVNEDISKSDLVTDVSKWFEVYVSSIQAQYFQKLSTAVGVAQPDSSYKQIKPTEDSYRDDSMTSRMLHQSSVPTLSGSAQSHLQLQSQIHPGLPGSTHSGLLAHSPLLSQAQSVASTQVPSLSSQSTSNSQSLLYLPPKVFRPPGSYTTQQLTKQFNDCKDNNSIRHSMISGHGAGMDGRYSTCQVCGRAFDMTAISGDELAHHISRCTTSRELKQKFMEFDKRIGHHLVVLSKENHLQMEQVLSKAMTVFGKRAVLNNAVLLLTKQTADVAPNGSDGNMLANLQKKLEELELHLFEKLENHDDNATETRAELSALRNIVLDAGSLLKEKRKLLRQCHKLFCDERDFRFISALCRGSYATVYLAKKVDSGEYYAIKVMEKVRVLEERIMARVKRERKILSATSRYPDMFVRLHCSFQTRKYLFMVQDFVQGGDCLTLITQLGTVPERTTKIIIAEVIVAVKFLHAHGIVHRDIKPDNVLITARGHAKLMDFGMAGASQSNHSRTDTGTTPGTSQDEVKRTDSHDGPQSRAASSWLNSDSSRGEGSSHYGGANAHGSGSTISFTGRSATDHLMHTPVGNYNYAPPEALIAAGYDHTIDWWCIGIMMFHFLAGRTPFEADTKEATQDNIVTLRIDWPALEQYGKPHSGPGGNTGMTYDPISNTCVHFISCLLKDIPRERLGYQGASSVMEHSYFVGVPFDCLYSMSQGPLTLSLQGDADTSYFDFFSGDYAAEPIPEFGYDANEKVRRSGRTGANTSVESEGSGSLWGGIEGEHDDLTSFSFNNI